MSGINRGHETIYIQHMGGYNKPVLLFAEGNVIRKLASFDNDESAEIFNRLLCEWFGIEVIDIEVTDD